MPKRVQIIFFIIAKFISFLVLSRVALSFGYILMEDLHRAVAQFYPSTPGGMPGASAPLPGPSGNSGSGWTSLLASGNESSPSGSSGGTIDQPQPGVEASSSAPAAEADKIVIPSPEISQGDLLGENDNQQPPLLPVIPDPLVSDEERLRELTESFRFSSFGRNTREDFNAFTNKLERALPIERNIEAALILDGYAPQRIRLRINSIRRILFSHPKKTVLLSEKTLEHYLSEIDTFGTRDSTPYKQVLRAIRNYDIVL